MNTWKNQEDYSFGGGTSMAYLFVAPIAIILIVIGGIKRNKVLLAIGACLAIFFAYTTYTTAPPSTIPDGFKKAEALEGEPGVDQLTSYLNDKFPDATYHLKPQKQGDSSSSLITVAFEEEPDWFYNYLVKEDGIAQVGVLAPKDEAPEDGEFFEEVE